MRDGFTVKSKVSSAWYDNEIGILIRSYLYHMKSLKFASDLVSKIISGEKTSTWRLFDDKDLKVNDSLFFINKANGEQFGTAIINSIKIKTLGTLSEEDWDGHERFASEDEMYNTYRKYYGDKVGPNSEVKILKFQFRPLITK